MKSAATKSMKSRATTATRSRTTTLRNPQLKSSEDLFEHKSEAPQPSQLQRTKDQALQKEASKLLSSQKEPPKKSFASSSAWIRKQMDIANQNRNCPRQKVDHVANEQNLRSVQQQAQNAAL